MEEEEKKSDFDFFKGKVFSFTYELVSNELSNNFYLILIIIESIQFIGYYNNGFMTFNTLGFQQFSQVSSYLNILVFLKTSNINLYLVPCFFCLSCLHVLFLFLGYRAFQERTQKINKEVADKNFHKNKIQFFANLLMVFYTTVLTIPIFQTSVTAFYCSANNPFTSQQDCYTGSHIFIVILGILNCVWLLMVSVFYTMYYYSRNPFSQNFMTCSSNWHSFGKFLIKIAPMIFLMYDPLFEFSVLFLIIMNIAYFGYLAIFSRFLFGFYRYNFHLHKIITGIQIFICLLNLNFILQYVLQNTSEPPNFLFLYWIGSSILISIIVVDFQEKMKKGNLKDINNVDKKSLPQILQYLIYLIYSTERKFTIGKGAFYLASIARTHKQKCEDPKCYCMEFFKAQKQAGYFKDKKNFYILLLSVIDRILKHNKKAYGFVILKAYILFYKLESSIKAATTISSVMSDKLDFSDDRLVKGLLFELNEQYSDTRDMEIYRKFNQYLLQQEQQSLTLTDLYLNYWEQLIDQHSSIPKLHHILSKIKASKQKLERTVVGALGIFNNHVRVLFLHKHLLKEVANDYLGAIRCEERYKIGLKESKLSNVDTVNKIQFRQNENLLVINLTRDYTSQSEGLGKYKILTISSNVKEFLGFTNTELKNQSVNRVIPRIYHACHDTYIDNILDRKNSDIDSRQIRIFPVTSEGYIIQCNLISKFMPSPTHGINIVSFLEQCDKNKDEFFIVYNSNNGIVDSLSAEAAMLLKDDTHRKNTNSIFAIPDNVNDLLPNWDYKDEVYRSSSRIAKSSRSLNKLLQCTVDVKEVEVTRSDGGSQKNIKILRCKGNFFDRMLSLEHETYENSPTIQKYLEHRRKASQMNEVNQGGTIEGEQVLIQARTHKVLDFDEDKKKTHMRDQITDKNVSIEQKLSDATRKCFISVQVVLLLLTITLCLTKAIVSYSRVTQVSQDIDLLVSLNNLQSELADTTFIISLAVTELAYVHPNMTLPYSTFNSLINVTQEFIELEDDVTILESMVAEANGLLVHKIKNNQIPLHDLYVDIRYQVSVGSRQYYTKQMTFIQSSYQYITYMRQLLFRLHVNQESIATVLQSSIFFYLYVNNIDVVPVKVKALQLQVVAMVTEAMQSAEVLFIIISTLMALLFLLSIVTTLLFYRYVLNNYVLKVLDLYERISLPEIQRYRDKCNSYKKSLKGKQIWEDEETENKRQNSGRIPSHGRLALDPTIEEDESQLLIQNTVIQEEEEEHYIFFESKPTSQNLTLYSIVSFILGCAVLIVIAFSFQSHSGQLDASFQALSRQNIAFSSIVRIRLYTQLSLNMLNYWNQTEILVINQELDQNFKQGLQIINDTGVNFTTWRPFLISKMHELYLVQSYVLANDTQQLNLMASQIRNNLEYLDQAIRFLHEQALHYKATAKNVARLSTNNLNTFAILTLLFIIIFWLFGARESYLSIIEQHAITYEMYSIIGYNLRKEVYNPK